MNKKFVNVLDLLWRIQYKNIISWLKAKKIEFDVRWNERYLYI